MPTPEGRWREAKGLNRSRKNRYNPSLSRLWTSKSREMNAYLSLFLVFLRLGLTSFGGPVAHIGFFREEFVSRRRWFSEAEYADKVALCQLIPGPASSQVGLLIGHSRAGYIGAFLAWLGFTLPSAAALAYLGITLANPNNLIPPLLLTLLKSIALAVVIQAVLGMARSFCTTRLDRSLMIVSAGLLTAFSAPWLTPVLILAAGVIAMLDANKYEPLRAPQVTASGATIGWLSLFFAGLMVLPWIATLTGPYGQLIDGFYRAGALVFGGGHVVLPLLADTTVTAGLIGSETFISGYGAAQAVPGPLFTFAAFLGGGIFGTLAGALVATLAIFLPAVAILFGMLPIWEAIKAQPSIRVAVGGANAAVVGVLLAALITMSLQTISSVLQIVYVAGVFLLLERVKVPAWGLVLISVILSYGLEIF